MSSGTGTSPADPLPATPPTADHAAGAAADSPAAGAPAAPHPPRARKLLRLFAGIHLYTALASAVWGVALGSLGGVGTAYAVAFGALAVASATAMVIVLRSDAPSLRWAVLPCSAAAILYFGSGLLTSSVPWLNLAAHALVPYLRRALTSDGVAKRS